MMPTQETVDAVNTTGEYGTYIPGGRMEVERGPWDAEAVSGWGPGDVTKLDSERWYVVQRADHSPHPIIWHSMAYDSAEFARYQALRREVRYEKGKGEDWRLSVPHVSHLAFMNHWSTLGGCYREGENIPALANCETKKCIETAIRDIRTIIEQGDTITRLLAYGEHL